MEKRNRKAGSRYSLRDRILAQIMIVLITVTMLPYESLVVHAASTTTVKSIGGIETEYEVDNGTSKDDIGLPSSLSVTIETVTSAEGATEETAPAVSEETVDKSVSWRGDYDGNTAGEYALTAEFDDSSLSYSKMPTVHVTVMEAETEPEPTTPEVIKTDDEDGDDDEDPDQGKSEQKTADEEEAEETSKPEAEDAEEEEAVEEVSKDPLEEKINIEGCEYSDQIEDFNPTKEFTINNEPVESLSGVTLEEGDVVKVKFTAKESGGVIEFLLAEFGKNAQGEHTIDELHTITYNLPKGINWTESAPSFLEYEVTPFGQDDPVTLFGDVTIEDGPDGKQVVVTWRIDPNKPSDVELLRTISSAGNMSMEFSIQGTVTGDEDQIPFGDDDTILVDNTKTMTVEKVFSPKEIVDMVKANESLRKNTKFSTTVMKAKTNADGSFVRDADKHIVYEEKVITFTYNDFFDENNPNAKYEISGLQPGTYTVTETQVPTIDKYTYEGDDQPSASVTLDTKDAKGVSFHNEYTKDEGSLAVTKSLKGADITDLTPAQLAAIDFAVYDASGKQVGSTFTYADIRNAQGVYKIEHLEPGEYTVKELHHDLYGHTYVSTSYNVKKGETITDGSGTVDTASGEVVVTKDETTTVNYTDTYTIDSSSLKFTKTFTTPESLTLTDEQKAKTKFQVFSKSGRVVWFDASGNYLGKTGSTSEKPVDSNGQVIENAIYEVSYADMENGSFEIQNIPVGEYSVQETHVTGGSDNPITGYTVKTQYKVNNAANWSSGMTASGITVVKNSSGQADFNNTYTESASLKLTKTFSGDINITTSSTLNTNIKNGTTFTIKDETGSVIKVKRDSWVTGSSTWHYDPAGGTSPIKFYDMGLNAQSKTMTINGLPFGTYTVTEQQYTVDGYTLETTYEVVGEGSHTDTSASVELSAQHMNDAHVKVTNKYTRDKGDLKVTKTFIDENGNLSDADKAKVAFSIKPLSGNAVSITYGDIVDAVGTGTEGSFTKSIGGADRTITVTKNSDNSYSFVIEGLPASTASAKYSVTEAGDKNIEGFSRETTVTLGEGTTATVGEDSATGIVVPKKTEGQEYVTPSVTFTNKYTPTGHVKISKTWGPTLSQDTYDRMQTEMRFIIRDEDGNIVYKRDADGNITDQYLFTYSNLTGDGVTIESGKKYTVEEVNVNVDGYIRTTTIINTVNIGSEDAYQDGEPKIVTVNPKTEPNKRTESNPSIVNQGETTEFAFYNTYAGGVGPGSGAYIYKNYSGLDDGEYDDDPNYGHMTGTEREAVHNRIMLLFTHYVSETDNRVVGEFAMSLTEAIRRTEAGGITLVEGGYYRIKELGRYTVSKDTHGNDVYTETTDSGTYSADASDMYYDWRYKIIVNGQELTENTPAYITVPEEDGQFVSISITNNYAPFGALKVTKDFEGLDAMSATDAASVKNGISFDLYLYIVDDGTWQNKGHFTLNQMTLEDGTYVKTFEHLAVGDYKVVETIASDSGHYTRTSYVHVDNKEATAVDGTVIPTIPDNTSPTAPAAANGRLEVSRGGLEATTTAGGIELPGAHVAAFDNEYELQTGNIEVTKNFTFVPGDAEVEDSEKNKVTFKIYRGSGNDRVQIGWNKVGDTYVYAAKNGQYSSFTYADIVAAGGTFKITKVPAGFTYEIEESNYNIDGFLVDVKVKATPPGTSTVSYKRSGTVTDKGTLKFDYDDNYTEIGRLVITKTFNPDSVKTTDEAKRVKFTVYKTKVEDGKVVPDGVAKRYVEWNPSTGAAVTTSDAIFTYADMTNGSYSMYVKPGTYIVKEENQVFSTEHYVFISAKANGEPYVDEDGASVEVERYSKAENNAAEVSFENNYTESGDLSLSKSINGVTNMTQAQMEAVTFSLVYVEEDGTEVQVKWRKAKDDDNRDIYIYDPVNGNITSFAFSEMKPGGSGSSTYQYTIQGLPAGTYKVTETVNGETSDINDPNNPFYGYIRVTRYTMDGKVYEGDTATIDLHADGQTVDFVNDYAPVKPMTVIKSEGDAPAGEVEIDGVTYPFWEFKLKVSDLRADSDIVDYFDTSDNDKATWFRLVTSDEADQDIMSQIYAARHNDHVNENVQLSSGTAPTDVTIDTSVDGQATFKLKGVDKTKFSEIYINYYLIPKDESVVEQLNTNNTSGNASNWIFTNTAEYKPLASSEEPVRSSVNYTYTCTGIEKSLLNVDEDGHLIGSDGKPTNIAHFEIVLNPGREQIGDKDKLTAYDTLSSNLKLDLGSFKVYKVLVNDEGEEEEVDASDEIHVIKCNCESKEHTVHITDIPNATKVIVRYSATVNVDGNVTLNNIASMEGYIKEVNEQVKIDEIVKPSISLQGIYLHKYNALNIMTGLGGAEFTLYSESGDKLTTFITDDSGEAQIDRYDDEGNHNLNYDTNYVLVETIAPVGYELPPLEDRTFYFRLVEDKEGVEDPYVDPDTGIEYQVFLSEETLDVENGPYSAEVELGALKNLIGGKISEGQFGFTLTAKNDAPTPAPESGSSTVTVRNDANGKAKFGKIKYYFSDLEPITDDEGKITGYGNTFEYEVKELDESEQNPHIEYDGTVHNVKVIVSLNDDQTDLDVEVYIDEVLATADNNVYFSDFTNEYSATGAMVLGVKKTIKGRKLRVEEFEFNLSLNDGQKPTIISAKNAVDADHPYDCDIVFPRVDYVIKDSEEPGYKDSTKVVVEDGKYTVYIDPDVLTKTDSTGKRYTEYNYTVSETRPQTSTNGVTYDEHTYDLTVRVIDNGDGTVDVIPYVNNSAITLNEDGVFELPYTFINVYKAEGEATPEGKKTMENGTLTAGQFKFDVTYGGKKIGQVTHDAAGKINYPTIKAVVKPEAEDSEVDELKIVKSGDYISQIVITKRNIEDFAADGYTFIFSEVQGTDASIEYDDVTYEVTATVAIDSADESKLKVSLTKPKDLDFINTLINAHGDAYPEGIKSVPDGVTLEAGKFSFDIYYNNEVIATATNAADGTINYPAIRFALDGNATATTVVYDETKKMIIVTANNMAALKQTYTFTVKERNGGEMIDGFIYGNQVYTLTASAEEGATPSTLKVNLSSNAKSLNFINTSYKAQGSDTPEGMKRLPDGVTLTAGQFKFNIKYDGAVIGQVTHDADGNINYPEIIFVLDKTAAKTTVKADARNNTTKITITANTLTELAKTYTFKISEVNGGQVIDGILYDVTEHELTATAAENADDKTKLDVTLSNNAKKLDFSNKEQGASGSDTLEGEKSIPEGVKLEAGQFTFNISYNNQVIGTVTHGADGVINYPTINFVLDKKVSGTTVDVDKYNNVTAITITANTLTELAKTYTFKIAEVNGGQSIDGFDFTDVIHTVTATAAPNPNNSSKLDVTLSDNHDKLDFVNDTYGAEGTNTPKGRKSVPEGVTLEEDYFTFLISYNDKVIGKVHNKADGNIKYPTIKFVLDKTAPDEPKVEVDAEDPTTLITITANTLDLLDEYYSFKIEEENGGETIDGITYASTVYTLTATATKKNNDKTKLDVKLSDNATALNFVNSSYKASGTKKISGTKSVPKGVDLSAYDFEFEIYYGNTLLGTVTNDKTTGAINYPKVTFILDPAGTEGVTAEVVEDTTTVTGITVTGRKLAKLADTYTFTIKEVHGGEMIDGIKYYGEPVVLTATAAQDPDDNKKLVITMSDNFEALNFVNDKYVAKGDKTPDGSKILEGRKLKDKEFTFEIYYNNDLIGKFTNDANGKILYPTVKFVLDAGGTEGVTVDDAENTTLITVTGRSLAKLAETYTFHVEEKDTGESGVSYPENFFDFTATAKENASDKEKLDVTLSDANKLDFINTYRAKGGSDRPEGKKIMKGRNLKAGEFTFEIKANDNTVLGKVTNDADGKIVYPTFYYEVDPHKTAGRTVALDDDGFLESVTIIYNNVEDLAEAVYTVTEVKYTGDNAEAGVTYDTSSSQKITVTPSVNADDESKLDVKAVAEAGKEFTNTYKAKGQNGFTGIKWLDTRMPENGEFTFVIKEGNTVLAEVKNVGTDIPYPDFQYVVDPDGTAGTSYDKNSNIITVVVNAVEDLAAGFNYTVSEKDEHIPYFGYDTKVYDLHVDVKATDEKIDEKTAKLDVKITKSTENNFTNTYSAEGALKLEAEKTLLGRILNKGEFAFELRDKDGKVLQTQHNDKTGKIVFDQINYTLDNMNKDKNGHVVDTDIHYTVSEAVPAGAVENEDGTYTYNGVTYDPAVFNITATLHDNKKGLIQVTVTAEPDGELTFDALLKKYSFKFGNAFVNFYAAEGKANFTGSKALRGRKIAADEFSFTISDANGVIATVKNKADGTITYPTFKYVVDHRVSETTTRYDKDANTIIMTVKNLEDMVNADTSVDPTVYSAKTYDYTVTEVEGSEAGVTYNTGTTTEYTVTATVSVNAADMGKLDVSFDPAKEVDFVNTYKAKGISQPITGTKALRGRIVTAKEFEFMIKAKDGTELGKVTNDENGVITYPQFEYIVDPDLEAGRTTTKDADGYLKTVTITYNNVEELKGATYTATEIVGTGIGITYDESTKETINVAVEVNADDASKLDVKAETETDDAVFTNYYKARGEKKIFGDKKLTYRLPEDEEFEFVISGEDGKEIARVKSSDMINDDHSGKTIKYPAFRYVVDYQAEAGTVYDAGKNMIIVTVNWVEDLKDGFTYKITEVNDGKDYFTYDTTEITLSVTVTPTGEEIEPHVEKLDVEIDDSEGNDFHNEYHAEGALQLYAEKTLLGRILNSGDFTFELNHTDETFENVIENVDTKDNKKDGSVTFDLIEYNLDSMDKDEYGYVKDTKYYYTVSEVVPTGAVENEDGTYTYNGVTYDPVVFNITATLHDNKKGLIEVTLKAEPDGELTFDALLKKYSFKFGNAFVNFYHAEGEDTISGTKTLRGRKLKEGEYQFDIKDAEGTVLATVSNDADGNILYPTFRYVVNHLAEGTSYTYDETNNTLTLTTNNLEDMVTPVDITADPVTYEPKDYIYTIDEVIPEGATDNGDGTYTYKGVTYNELVNHYDLTATVAVNADDMGILDVSIEPKEELDFINTYRAKGEDTVVGKKILKGADIKDYEGMFSFTVSDSEGNLITTVSNDAEGNILYPTFRYVVNPDAEAGAVYDEEENVYTVTVNAYEDLAEVYRFTVTEVEGDIEDMAYNVGEKLEYEITVTVVADDEDPANLNVVALPNTAVDFVNRQYFKAGLYKVSENSGEALKGAVIRLVRVDDGKIIDEWTTDGSVHIINLIDIGTGTFRFVEVKAPSGYHLARNIEFTMSEDGEFSSTYDHIYDDDGNAIFIMRDPKDASTGDEAPLAAAGGALAVGLAGLAAVLAQKKKRRA